MARLLTRPAWSRSLLAPRCSLEMPCSPRHQRGDRLQMPPVTSKETRTAEAAVSLTAVSAQRTVHVRLPPSHKHHAGAVGGETLARHVYFWRCTASCPSPPRSPRSARSSPCPTTCRCRATAPRPAETLRPGVRVRDSFGWCGRKRQDGQVCTAKRSVTPSILCSLNGRTYLYSGVWRK